MRIVGLIADLAPGALMFFAGVALATGAVVDLIRY